MAGSRVAVFIDDPNFSATTESLGIRVNWDELLRKLESESHILTIQKIYVDSNPNFPQVENKFLNLMRYLGFDVVPVPLKVYGFNGQKDGKRYKSLTDSWIMVDIMEHLALDEFDTMFLFSGDSDYQYVVSKVKNYGKQAIIVSSQRNLAKDFQAIGEVLLIEELDKIFKFPLPRLSA